MTANELRALFNESYGIDRSWPKTYEVDADTYANVCQAVFSNKISRGDAARVGNEQAGTFYSILDLAIGLNGGILFKNVELILKGKS